MIAQLPKRIASKIEIRDCGYATACWVWAGACSSSGYGLLKWETHTVSSHRLVYELLVGPIQDGLETDHLCRIPLCANPAHLEPVTHRENVMRGNSISALNARKTHCPKGHTYDEKNTRLVPHRAGRKCIECERERERSRPYRPSSLERLARHAANQRAYRERQRAAA